MANRATKLFLMVLLFAASSRAQTVPSLARANVLPDHIQPARKTLLKPFLDVRDAFLFKDKAESVLAVTQGLFLISDGIVTRADVRGGANQGNRSGESELLSGPYPTWKRMAPLGSRSRNCRHLFGNRKMIGEAGTVLSGKSWWVPQVAGIGGNSSGTAYGILAR